MVVKIGVTDIPPTKWKKKEPVWNETLTIMPGDTFHDAVDRLCKTSVKKRREYDYLPEDHLWDMKIATYDDAVTKNDPFQSSMFGPLPTKIVKWEYFDTFKEDEYDFSVLPSNVEVSSGFLKGKVIFFDYDYGDTTSLFLKVLE